MYICSYIPLASNSKPFTNFSGKHPISSMSINSCFNYSFSFSYKKIAAFFVIESLWMIHLYPNGHFLSPRKCQKLTVIKVIRGPCETVAERWRCDASTLIILKLAPLYRWREQGKMTGERTPPHLRSASPGKYPRDREGNSRDRRWLI